VCKRYYGLFTEKEKRDNGSFMSQYCTAKRFHKYRYEQYQFDLEKYYFFAVFSKCTVNCAQVIAPRSFPFRRKFMCKTSCTILVKSNWCKKGKKGNWNGAILRDVTSNDGMCAYL
jgi:hypothetical protein